MAKIQFQFGGLQDAWLLDKVKKTRNTNYLIKHLREGGEVSPTLARFIADILEGKIRAKLRPISLKEQWFMTPEWIRRNCESYERMINEGAVAYPEVMELLRGTGHKDLETKAGVSRAARIILAKKTLGITERQLDELRFPRNRKK